MFAGFDATIQESYSAGSIAFDFIDNSGGGGTYDGGVGGLVGKIWDGSAGSDNGDVRNSFSVTTITVPAAFNTNTGRAIGQNNHTDAALLFSNVFYLAGSTCTNCDNGDDAQVSTQPTIGDFYDPLNAPLSTDWDFTDVWLNNDPTALPTLR